MLPSRINLPQLQAQGWDTIANCAAERGCSYAIMLEVSRPWPRKVAITATNFHATSARKVTVIEKARALAAELPAPRRRACG